MMRFRKRGLSKINIAFTNQITSLFAGWLSWDSHTCASKFWQGLPAPVNGSRFPMPVRLAPRIVGAEEHMELSIH